MNSLHVNHLLSMLLGNKIIAYCYHDIVIIIVTNMQSLTNSNNVHVAVVTVTVVVVATAPLARQLATAM